MTSKSTGDVGARLARLLAPFRELEARIDIAAVVDEPAAMRVLAVWRAVRTEWKPKGAEPDELLTRWIWIWEHVWLDLAELGVRTMLPRRTALAVLRSCVSGRLVYPDGTLHREAEALVESFVESRYPGQKRGRPRSIDP